MFPTAGEAVWSFKPASASVRGDPRPPDIEASPERALRRAKVTVRRYCTANRLDRLVTLTYAPPFCTDPRQLREDVGRFVRRLRRCVVGHKFPYLWVPELHKDGQRLHAHLVLGEYVPKASLAATWPHGFVDIRRLRVAPGGGSLERARQAARYASKYVGKAFASGAVFGCHRHEVAQGFQPREDCNVLPSEEAALAWAVQYLGGAPPSRRWSSRDSPDWTGPSCVVAFWS